MVAKSFETAVTRLAKDVKKGRKPPRRRGGENAWETP